MLVASLRELTAYIVPGWWVPFNLNDKWVITEENETLLNQMLHILGYVAVPVLR